MKQKKKLYFRRKGLLHIVRTTMLLTLGKTISKSTGLLGRDVLILGIDTDIDRSTTTLGYVMLRLGGTIKDVRPALANWTEPGVKGVGRLRWLEVRT